MVFFHLLDAEILELYQAQEKYRNLVMKLQADLLLLLAVLPADEIVVISPTFLLENEICELILRDNQELFENYYLAALMKESTIDDVNSKKQVGYKRVRKVKRYKNAYYGDRVKKVKDIRLHRELKSTLIGPTSFRIYLNLLKEECVKNEISSKMYDDIVTRLKETETTSFLWESVYEQLISADIPDKIIRKLRIREIMSQSYLEAYQEEGILLVQDKRFYQPIRTSQTTRTYDLLKIDRIFSFLDIKTMILSLPLKMFCKLKQDGDYILAIEEVHNYLFKNIPSEEIITELKKRQIDRKLKLILDKYRVANERGKPHMIDILIMVATSEEERAIIKTKKWERKSLSDGREYFTRVENNVQFALARPYAMGESDTAIMAQIFIRELNPYVISMAGFCAGKAGKVKLGDIIVANKVYNYDIGKQLTETEILPEISNYSLDGGWIQYIERLDITWKDDIEIPPPVDFDWQVIDLLSAILKNGFINYAEMDRSRYPNWSEVISEIIDQKYISINNETSTLSLTGEGKDYISKRILLSNENMPPEPSLLINPIATGTKVQVWEDVFGKLEKFDRKTYALDMESHVIGKLGSYNKIPYIVVKGVGDYANESKTFANRYIEYTSLASCHFIIKLFSADDFISKWKK